MLPRIKKSLFDIKVAIEEFIEEDTDFDTYQNNKLLRRAVEREIEIIGEAVQRILKINPNLKLTNARKIVDTRNRVIHAYDNVDDVIIWGIVTLHLPELKKEVEIFLNDGPK